MSANRLLLLVVSGFYVLGCQPDRATLRCANLWQKKRRRQCRPLTVRLEGPLTSTEGISHANRDLVFALTLMGLRKFDSGNPRRVNSMINTGLLKLIDWCPSCKLPKEYQTLDNSRADVTIRSLTWLPIMLPGLSTHKVWGHRYFCYCDYWLNRFWLFLMLDLNLLKSFLALALAEERQTSTNGQLCAHTTATLGIWLITDTMGPYNCSMCWWNMGTIIIRATVLRVQWHPERHDPCYASCCQRVTICKHDEFKLQSRYTSHDAA